jgi:hypothetical protein
MMPEMSDDALDALMDLSHDLGKYLRLPLAMLPADAGPAAVRGAVETALLRTRVGPSGVRPAREIWEGLRAEIAGPLAGSPGFQDLEDAVERALGWERALDDGQEGIDRAAVAADFEAVAERIRDLIGEITRG